MNLRLSPVSGAMLALLAGFWLGCAAPAARAQVDSLPPLPAQTPAPPAPATPPQAPKPVPDRPELKLPAAIGGMIGVAGMFADADYSNTRTATNEFGDRDAEPRFSFLANFRYAVTPWLRWQISPGFFWVGYDHASPLPFQDLNNPTDTTKEKVITLVLPVSFQLQYMQRRGPWLYHVGAGPGVYRIWVENRRKVIKDPLTKVNHKGFYPGVSGQIGVERFLKALPATAIEVSLGAHWAFADRPEQFPNGFNSALLGVDLRVGANYHFDVGRFEKKKAAAPAVK